LFKKRVFWSQKSSNKIPRDAFLGPKNIGIVFLVKNLLKKFFSTLFLQLSRNFPLIHIQIRAKIPEFQYGEILKRKWFFNSPSWKRL